MLWIVNDNKREDVCNNAFSIELSDLESTLNKLAIVIFKIFTLTFRDKENEAQIY